MGRRKYKKPVQTMEFQFLEQKDNDEFIVWLRNETKSVGAKTGNLERQLEKWDRMNPLP